MKKYKIQNWSPKISHAFVPLSRSMSPHICVKNNALFYILDERLEPLLYCNANAQYVCFISYQKIRCFVYAVTYRKVWYMQIGRERKEVVRRTGRYSCPCWLGGGTVSRNVFIFVNLAHF
jgi:hypothetical protein